MIQITIRQLRYFVATYEEASFTRAAEREHCSQPALSAQIANLEKILERELFERSVNGVRPTAAGQRFYRHAVSILSSVNQAQIDMAEVSGLVEGQVRVGLIPSIVRGLLPSFLPEFVDTYPMIDLRVIQGFSDALSDAVLAQTVEFAVVLEPPRHEGIEIEHFAAESMVLISNPALGLPRGEALRLSNLAPLNLVVPSPNHTLRRNIERHIWTKEIRVARLLEMDTVHGMIDFVAGSKWATILPIVAVACDLGSDRFCINPIGEPRLEADLHLIRLTQQPLTATARLFAEALRQRAAALGSSVTN
ncbi:MAG: LysR family transcriptional regulator [Betaproteobacteria bacterium]|nr:LysR family transcriptional regulator [Betaproteobacteria bacterium]MDH3437373.1 LysR family transcriptional regulator [Betaproteobacteria bacterium]